MRHVLHRLRNGTLLIYIFAIFVHLLGRVVLISFMILCNIQANKTSNVFA